MCMYYILRRIQQYVHRHCILIALVGFQPLEYLEGCSKGHWLHWLINRCLLQRRSVTLPTAAHLMQRNWWHGPAVGCASCIPVGICECSWMILHRLDQTRISQERQSQTIKRNRSRHGTLSIRKDIGSAIAQAAQDSRLSCPSNGRARPILRPALFRATRYSCLSSLHSSA